MSFTIIVLALGDFCTQLNSRKAYSHAPLEIVHSYLFLHFKMKYVTHSPFRTHVTFNQCSFVPCSFPLQLLAKLDIKFQLSHPLSGKMLIPQYCSSEEYY